MPEPETVPDWLPREIDTTKPHSARMYDYYLGGKDHFPADRVAAERAAANWQAVGVAVRENRTFLGRSVRWLATDRGIRQFLDIGTGIPTAGNTHEVAQAVDPTCRVVYVDNDPIVLAHARALLTSTSEGRTDYIDADIRDPDAILERARPVLDFNEPIALMLVAILHFLPDEFSPYDLVARYMESLPAGSYLVASHVTPEYDPEGVQHLVRTYNAAGIPAQARSLEQFEDFFVRTGLTLEPPGAVLVSDWRPDTEGPRPTAAEVSWHGAVGRKPKTAAR